MKLSLNEFRKIIAESVSKIIDEARKKVPIEKSEEMKIKDFEKHIMGLPGFKHCKPLDFSKPQGKKNLLKKQGASNIGPWTSESKQNKCNEAINMLIKAICKEELSHFYKKLG